MALDCFFAVWFVVGNVWIFGGHSNADQAPNLYRYLNLACIIMQVNRQIIIYFTLKFICHNKLYFNVYRLSIVFLTFSCIGYAMPFILCATICCCLPCIISVLGFREDPTQSRGATSESINSLPTYKFKAKKNRSGHDKESNTGVVEGGIVAAGTEKERVISGEDAVLSFLFRGASIFFFSHSIPTRYK